METTKHIIIASFFVLFSTVAAISEESQLSNTREASCVLQITVERYMLNYESIDSIIRSSGVLGKAASEILESSLEERRLRTTIRSQRDINKSITYTYELNVSLAEGVKPAAIEFLKALVENLQKSLKKTFIEYKDGVIIQYEMAMQNYKEAESKLNNLNEEPAIRVIPNEDYEIDYDTKRQLEKVVDLSMLNPSMSFADVLDEIKNSVEPPLQIQPNWRDLADLPDIVPETPAEMEPLPKVKVRTAIETLLSNLTIFDDTPLGYIYRDGVITIASKEALPKNLVTLTYDISGLLVNGRTSDFFIQAIIETIEPESWSSENKGKIIDMQGGIISIYNTPEIQEKITDFLRNFPKEIPSEPVGNIPVNMLIEEKHDLVREKRNLEMETARLEARQEAAVQHIAALSGKMKNKSSLILLQQNLASLESKLAHLKSTLTERHPEVLALQKEFDELKKQLESSQEDAITTELEQLIERQAKILNTLKAEHEIQSANNVYNPGLSKEISEVEEKLARLKIELAKRREELARPMGIESLSTFNQNLSMTILDLAEKKAELQVVDKQLSEIESQIKAATTTDPKILKYRQARNAFEEAEKRLNELREIEANLQAPQVIAIGLE